jgi:hypothetical protein
MSRNSTVCVYCGSRTGDDPVFAAAAAELGRRLAADGHTLVYGGGRVGLMGLLADAAVQAGGRVVGIIPRHLQRAEVGHGGVTELVLVDSMHERKAEMAARSDIFVVLPGGLGTMDETFEIVTWRQLGLHDKPIVIFNLEGCWSPFVDLVDHIVGRGFAAPEDRALFAVVDTLEEVLTAVATAPTWGKSLDRTRA